MISHYLIDTLYSRVGRGLIELLEKRGCVKVFEQKLESSGSFDKTVSYVCKSSLVYMHLKGDALYIDLIGEGSEELFLEISRILPVEYSFARRMLRGIGDA